MLSLILAAKYRRPLPICLGILIATLLNHALAAGLGAVLAAWLTPGILKWIVAISFLAIGLWTLIPDTIDDEALPAKRDAGGKITSVAITQPEGVFDFKKIDDAGEPATTITTDELMQQSIDAIGGEANWRKITTRYTEASRAGRSVGQRHLIVGRRV